MLRSSTLTPLFTGSLLEIAITVSRKTILTLKKWHCNKRKCCFWLERRSWITGMALRWSTTHWLLRPQKIMQGELGRVISKLLARAVLKSMAKVPGTTSHQSAAQNNSILSPVPYGSTGGLLQCHSQKMAGLVVPPWALSCNLLAGRRVVRDNVQLRACTSSAAQTA